MDAEDVRPHLVADIRPRRQAEPQTLKRLPLDLTLTEILADGGSTHAY